MPTPTSIGYDGSVDEAAFALLGPTLGHAYTVVGPSAWKVTTVSNADRTVSVAAGIGAGKGVRDEATLPTTIQLDPAPATSAVWYLVVARRNWNTNTTTFMALTPGTATSQIPAARKVFTLADQVDDQPLALVQITDGVQVPTQVIDLRCWQPGSGAYVRDKIALQYLLEPGAQVRIGVDMYYGIVNASGQADWQYNSPRQRVWKASRGGTVDEFTKVAGWSELLSVTIPDAQAGTYLLSAQVPLVQPQGSVANGALRFSARSGTNARYDSLEFSADVGAVTVLHTPVDDYLHPGGSLTVTLAGLAGDLPIRIENTGSRMRVFFIGES